MTVHVIGAGLSGLSAALALTEAEQQVIVYEAGPAAGGRCRSYFDRELGLEIDNGNHLLLSGNKAAFGYLDAIGSADRLAGPSEPLFPFMDVRSGERWSLRPNRGRLPWWICVSGRRVPGTRLADYLGLLALRWIADERTVAEVLPAGLVGPRLIAPLAVAALNTRPEEGLARLLGAVVRETLMKGGAACLPRYPRNGLSGAFIQPAIAALRRRGAEIQFGRRIGGLVLAGGHVGSLQTQEGDIPLRPSDAVVLAVPPWVASALLPQIVAPDAFEAILNVHFRIAADPGPAGFIGLIGGTAEWVFVKREHVSVTISAANRLVDQSAESIATSVWPDVCTALRFSDPSQAAMPPWRVVKERRATFAATAAQERKRPGPRTPIANLALAGDWTDTGLPATIEGAISSGRRAAAVVLAH